MGEAIKQVLCKHYYAFHHCILPEGHEGNHKSNGCACEWPGDTPTQALFDPVNFPLWDAAEVQVRADAVSFFTVTLEESHEEK